MKLRIKRIGTHTLPHPAYATPGSSGLDFRTVTSVFLPVGQRMVIALGFAIEIPPGFEGTMRPRSGLSRRGLDLTFGTIDSDYRGELMACLANNGFNDESLSVGDRICQLVIAPIQQVDVEEVPELSDTSRGSGGSGSTGLH